jgi:hypothetical protein
VAFVRPVNGAFAQEVDAIGALLAELSRADNINTMFASPTAAGIERVGLTARHVSELRSSWTVVTGAWSPEQHPDGTPFRWCGPQVLLRLDGGGPHRLHVGTMGLAPGEEQTIHVVTDDVVTDSLTLSADHADGHLTLSGPPGQLAELQSGRAFSPCWSGSTDYRLLSFWLVA